MAQSKKEQIEKDLNNEGASSKIIDITSLEPLDSKIKNLHLTPNEKALVDLISDAIIKKTFKAGNSLEQ